MSSDVPQQPRNNVRRYNPLLDEWVIVAANRVTRPWSGAKTSDPSTAFQSSDAVNPLAPGGVRAGGKITPAYDSIFVFPNDFPSFTDFPSTAEGTGGKTEKDDDLFRQEEIRGVCRVICYHPASDKSIALMDDAEAQAVVRLWMDQYAELSSKWTWVQIFENRGAAVGSSNAHPHGQIWAGDFLPSLPARKEKSQKAYYVKHGRPLLVDYLERELASGERIVAANDHWAVLVPFWAVWPYETMILPRRHVQRMADLTQDEQTSLAAILRTFMIQYDNIFECPFPFGMGWLGAPTGPEHRGIDHPHWQLHAMVHPPLLRYTVRQRILDGHIFRSATVPKYMAGYEILAEPQRDITPEQAAATIRAQSQVHYTKRA